VYKVGGRNHFDKKSSIFRRKWRFLLKNFMKRSRAVCWVTKVIGEIGVEAGLAIPALTELGFHTDPTVRYLAAESLRKIGY
jgi:hypothetical protein